MERAASVGAAMGADIVINYPLWIVAKRVGAGLSALPPLHRLYAGGGALWVSIAPTTIIEDGVSTLLKPRCGDLAASAASGAIAGICVKYLRDVASRTVHHRGPRQKSIGPRDRRGALPARRRRWSCVAAWHACDGLPRSAVRRRVIRGAAAPAGHRGGALPGRPATSA